MLALGSENDAIAFLVAAGIVYEIIAKDVSSPQTCELNAKKRAPTLMKWVHVGQVEAAAFIGIACWFQPKHAKPILLGGVLAMAITEIEYLYAKQSGLNSTEEPTEEYGSGNEMNSTTSQAIEGGATAALVSSAVGGF